MRIVPTQFHLTHIKSQWAEDLLKTLEKRPSLRSQAKPEGFDKLNAAAVAKYPQYKDRIELKVAQLITLDNSKLLGETDLATKYLELLASHKKKAQFMATYNEKQSNCEYERVQEERMHQDNNEDEDDEDGEKSDDKSDD